jgi:adenine-specific DNA-methyltransferase
VTTELIKTTLLSLLPTDGSTVGNTSLRRSLEAALASEGVTITEDDYWSAQTALIEEGYIATGKGRGGSVKLIKEPEGGFELKAPTAKAESEDKVKAPKVTATARATSASSNEPPQIISYRHPDKRVNNPEVGMVNTATDPEAGKTKWAYDPHLDPTLQFDPQRGAIETLIDDALASGDNQRMKDALEELKRLQSPYLNWAGKAERTSFEIDTVSLHVHERIDPASILSAVRKAMQGEGKSKGAEKAIQPGLFDAPFESLPLRDAIDFYRHERGWANRLIAGDSLLVMNSMLQKESMAGKVQMIFVDPPYGIKYGSNFQPFVGKKDVKDRSDADLTQEPEMLKAFRDTWELGIHSYLTYLRDRLFLAKELLNKTGSCFIQISDENLHHTRELCDEIFGSNCFIALITFRKKTMPLGASFLEGMDDYLLWYAKDKNNTKYHQLFIEKDVTGDQDWKWIELSSGEFRQANKDEHQDHSLLPSESSLYRLKSLEPSGPMEEGMVRPKYRGLEFDYPKNGYGTNSVGMERLTRAGRTQPKGSFLNYRLFLDDYGVSALTTNWQDTVGADDKRYVVQTNTFVLQRCILMTTDPGDLVLDPTCGSGTSAVVSEKLGRRWITCDTSRVAITLAKQRLMTSSFDYFELKYPHEGLKGGFIYKTVPHVTLKSIANNPDINSIYEQFHPQIEVNLQHLNIKLSEGKAPAFTPSDGIRKGKKIDISIEGLLEWEVPFDWPNDWPKVATQAFEDFHKARMRMQQKIDESIASHADQETLYDQPTTSKTKLRITGPFTVEAVPFPSVKSLDEANGPEDADASIARTGESGRQHQWRDELLKAGIRGKGGQMLKFADLEPLPFDASIRNLHAIGHLETGEPVVVSFGPEHAALEQRQVESAKNEASDLFPTPKMIVFCAFTFDPEAAKDIDGIKGITALKAQMNTDLLTEDLKKARSSNQSFWLMGQPEIEVRTRKDGQFEVEVHGFDYFDTVKGELVSGGKSKIAMWSLDTDYDERSLFPRQVFFPQAGKGEGWEKLKKNIRAELDESLLHQYQGTVSLPFEAGENRKIAVKIVDDRGIESLKVITL